MSPRKFLPAFLSVVVWSIAAPAAEDPTIACRRVARDLAGAWANDGFRMRESSWSGTLAPGKPAVVRVSLLAGNRYWFTACAAATAGEISVAVYTDTGQPVPTENYRDGVRAAARFEPVSSGSYLVKIAASQSSPAPFCLVYSYK